MTAAVLPTKEALHTAARRYCIDRLHLLEERDHGEAAGTVRARFDLAARDDVLYAMGARYYAPRLGRFLQQDPIASGSESQYAYAGSDPCNNADPTGLTVCYHKVSHQQVQEKVERLGHEAAQANVGAGVATAAAAVEVFIPFVGQAAAIPTGVIAGAAAIYAGHLSDEQNTLQNGDHGRYYANGFTVQYNSNVLWMNTPCAPGDSTKRPSGLIVRGSPFDQFVPAH